MVTKGVADPVPMVRIDAFGVTPLREETPVFLCPIALEHAKDEETPVALAAIDRLAGCAALEEVPLLLDDLAGYAGEPRSPRGWHRAGHALVALATAAPDQARMRLEHLQDANNPLGSYLAKARAVLDRRAAVDDEQNTAVETPGELPPPFFTADGLQRLAAPRARVTIRDVGTFDLALLTMEAPATVMRFAQLASSGLMAGSLVVLHPNEVAAFRAANPGAEAAVRREEPGVWPHVRGAVGFSIDDGLFIDLVDNPRFDHEYTVFGQLLNGLDVLDQLLDGDIIERVEILP